MGEEDVDLVLLENRVGHFLDAENDRGGREILLHLGPLALEIVVHEHPDRSGLDEELHAVIFDKFADMAGDEGDSFLERVSVLSAESDDVFHYTPLND